MRATQFIRLFCFVLTCQAPLLVAQKATTLPDWKVKPTALTVLNSPFRDVNISITPNGKYLYFMSARGGMPWSSQRVSTLQGKQEFDGDIWFSHRADNGDWEKPTCVGEPICTSAGEDEPNISADGQTAYFQSWKMDWANTGGPYYRTDLHGDKWGKPVGLGGGINQFFRQGNTATDGMSISPDGKTFVVACGTSYEGAMDIYISRKDAKGVWSVLEKLNISTAADDRSVFIGADNKTLYFGSAGWGGFGKLDIFKTTIEEGTKCGDVYNIGKPFNTAEEDYGFVMDIVRNDVYFVRNSDIFYAHLGEKVADSRIQAAPVVIIDGTVKDESGKSIEATVYLVNSANQTIAQARSNAITGEYSLSFPRKEGDYKQQIRFNDNYTIEKEMKIDNNTKQVIVQPIVAESPKLIVQKPIVIAAKTIEEPTLVKAEEKKVMPKRIPDSVILKSILFDFNKDVLKTEGKALLSDLANTAKAAQSYRIQVMGHADAVGDERYNVSLSEKRTKQVVQFLTEQGIPLSKMGVFSQGEYMPVAENDTEESRAKNRRVEVYIVFRL
jgi:outer membrane protein OmpA-like peptidoglycan-associated protein